jgi:DNA-binding NarL/FixJ family response regulator
MLTKNKEKILVLEDENITANYIEDILKNHNYEVVGILKSGENIFEVIQKNKPDIILMDINLKGDIDGIFITQSINKKFNIPVIYVTAYSDELTIEKAKLTDPAGYVLKPIREDDLIVSIKMALHRKKIDKLNQIAKGTPKKSKDSRKKDILLTSTKIIGTKGIAALTIANIAKELGLTGPAIYKHFRKREELLQYIIKSLEDNFETYKSELTNHSNIEDKIGHIAKVWCNSMEKENPLINVLFSQVILDGSDYLSQNINKLRDSNKELIISILKKLQDKSLIKVNNLEKTERLIAYTIIDSIAEWENSKSVIDLNTKVSNMKKSIKKILNYSK